MKMNHSEKMTKNIKRLKIFNQKLTKEKKKNQLTLQDVVKATSISIILNFDKLLKIP